MKWQFETLKMYEMIKPFKNLTRDTEGIKKTDSKVNNELDNKINELAEVLNNIRLKLKTNKKSQE